MHTLRHKLTVVLSALFLLLCSWSAASQPAPPGSTPQNDLEALRAEMNRIAFEGSEIPPRQMQDIEERFERHVASKSVLPADWRMLLHLELRSWRFARVDAYRRSGQAPSELLDGVTLPTRLVGEDSARAPFWTLDFKDQELRHSTVEAETDPVLLVVFHPLCNVCKRLTADLDANPALGRFMRECALWLGNIEGNFSLDVFESWAAAHPALALRFIRDWQLVESQATFETPTFRVMKQGRVVEELIGWPRESGAGRLGAFVEKHGMSLTSGCRASNQAR